ncbi:hypothetical protein B5K08_13360 [Rhizobium leguminosarum bv. trifolii]|nr:hypothetical protein B5K08_13360 [Rhizobium leguminosarum bv. trifolii]
MQKLRRQKDYTFLFEVRDVRLLRRNGYVPVATTPRLNPAIQFLVDVGLVDDEGLTERARELLRRSSVKYLDRMARRSGGRPYHSAISTTFAIEFAALEEAMLP